MKTLQKLPEQARTERIPARDLVVGDVIVVYHGGAACSPVTRVYDQGQGYIARLEAVWENGNPMEVFLDYGTVEVLRWDP